LYRSFKEPVRQIWERSKKGKISNRCAVSIHLLGVSIYEEIANGTYKSAWSHAIEDISYCIAEPGHRRLFSWIARSRESNELECHVVMCKNSQSARALADYLAQTFYQSYRAQQQIRLESFSFRANNCAVCQTINRHPSSRRLRGLGLIKKHAVLDETDYKQQNDHYERISLNTPMAHRMVLEDDEKSLHSVSQHSIDYDTTLADEESIKPVEYYQG
jgi:hypothetical protein